MNVIEYLETQLSCFEAFCQTYDVDYNAVMIKDGFGDGGSSDLLYVKKTRVSNIIEALMLLVVQEFVRYGGYYFDETLDGKYQIVFNFLKAHYATTQFETSESVPSLFDCMSRYDNPESVRKVNINYDWSKEVELAQILKLQLFEDKVLAKYQLLTEWNDEDYFYETENFYIRFNWATGA